MREAAGPRRWKVVHPRRASPQRFLARVSDSPPPTRSRQWSSTSAGRSWPRGSEGLLDAICERIAGRAAELILERLQLVLEGAGPGDGSNLLDAKAVAGKPRVPVGAVYKMSASGKLPALKVGGRLRFRVSDVERFIEQGTRSEDKVQELAAAAQTDAGRAGCSTRCTGRPRRETTVRGRADHADEHPSRAAVEPALKVLTNNNPGAAGTRRSGG
jgi:excisionase family DNA binding protein